MLVNGVKEWSGNNGQSFLQVKRKLEDTLLKRGYEYFYFGMVADRKIYTDNVSVLGEKFLDNYVEIELNDKKKGKIISPEGTFRTYDYLKRNNFFGKEKGKFFYSNEYLRNEPVDEVSVGKTISFWQTGFEIFGYNEFDGAKEAVATIIDCFNEIGINITLRISDKRFLKLLMRNLTSGEKAEIYNCIEEAKDDPGVFFDIYSPKNPKMAVKVRDFLLLENKKDLKVNDLRKVIMDDADDESFQFIEKIITEIEKEYSKAKIQIVPFISKSWAACDNLLFDVRIDDYPYALAGGGSLDLFGDYGDCLKYGGGIGVTRVLEYLIGGNH